MKECFKVARNSFMGSYIIKNTFNYFVLMLHDALNTKHFSFRDYFLLCCEEEK